MKPDLHLLTIDAVLRYIPRLERKVSHTQNPAEQKRLTKSLHQQNKRLERMISYEFRKALANLCQESGIENKFLE